MATPAKKDNPDLGPLERLIAGQAQADARFDEVFHRLDKAEKTAAEARDNSRDILAMLREQDTKALVAEVRAEARQQLAALRQDVVKANTNLKSDVDAAAKRLDELEVARSENRGMAKGARLIVDGIKLIVAAGGGAFLFKQFGGH